MPGDLPQLMRQEVEHLLAESEASSDEAEKRRLASRAFALAQSAEATERSRENRARQGQFFGYPGSEKNLRIVARKNLRWFLGCLYIETDKAQRTMYWNLLLGEQRWFAEGDERQEELERLFRDCSERIQRQESLLDAERAAGLDVTRTQTQLNNMLETEALLRELLQK